MVSFYVIETFRGSNRLSPGVWDYRGGRGAPCTQIRENLRRVPTKAFALRLF